MQDSAALFEGAQPAVSAAQVVRALSLPRFSTRWGARTLAAAAVALAALAIVTLDALSQVPQLPTLF